MFLPEAHLVPGQFYVPGFSVGVSLQDRCWNLVENVPLQFYKDL